MGFGRWQQLRDSSFWARLFPNWGKPPVSEERRPVVVLDRQEQAVLNWMAEGYTPRWIAETMLLSKRGARKLFRRVYRKLGVKNAREVSRFYRNHAQVRGAVSAEGDFDAKLR